ncbi:MAG: hypothetical protein QM760_04115 [Nibricoccus sp.]
MALSLLAIPARLPAQDLTPGRVIEKIPCKADATQSYALYLPSNYATARTWPVLYCFDPRARGARAIECFRVGAEKFGYLVVGLNNSRNGPWEENKSAIEAVLRDTHARLAVNRARLYTAGLSGGARVAVRLAMAGLAPGAIVCSGGFPTEDTPAKMNFIFFGTTGVDDCNYDEMRRIDDDLDKQGAIHRVAIFAGGHEWLPQTLGTQAIEWLEIQGMRTGLRQRDAAIIDSAFQSRLAALPGTAPEKWLETKSLAADFKGLCDTSALEKSAAELGASRELAEWRKLERKAEKTTALQVNQLVEAAAEGFADGMRRSVDTWRKQATESEDSLKRRVSRRTIQGAAIAFEQTARAHFSENQFAISATYYEAILMLQPERIGFYYDVARARILDGDKKAALAALKKGADSGSKDFARIENEKDFKPLQNDAAYLEIISAMKKNALRTETSD